MATKTKTTARKATKNTNKNKAMASKSVKKTAPVKASSAKPAVAKVSTKAVSAPFKSDFFSLEDIMSKTPFQFDKMAQEAANASQQQMEAAVKSSTVFFKGMEDIMKTCIELSQDCTEKSTSAMKSLMACKTLNELTDAQNKFAQQSFDDFMSCATKLSEMSVKVCTECMEPINSQMGKTMKKASESRAA